MCGIVGYVGPREATPILVDGLKRLEYRGYDSAGIAVLGDDGLVRVTRSEGKLGNLTARIESRAAGRPDRHRAHPLGHPRPPVRGERPPAPRRVGPGRRHPQRDHRELPAAQEGAPGPRRPVHVGDRLGGHRPGDRRGALGRAGHALRRGRPYGPVGDDGHVRRRRPLGRRAARPVRRQERSPDRPRPRRRGEPRRLRRDGAPAAHARPRLPRGRRLRPADRDDGRGDRPRRSAAEPPLAAGPVGCRRGREGGLPPLHGQGDRRAADGRRRDGGAQALARDGALQRGRDGGLSRGSSPASTGSSSSPAARAGTRGSSGSSSSRRSRASRSRSTTPPSSATGRASSGRERSSSASRSRARRPTPSRRSPTRSGRARRPSAS